MGFGVPWPFGPVGGDDLVGLQCAKAGDHHPSQPAASKFVTDDHVARVTNLVLKVSWLKARGTKDSSSS